MIDEPRSGAALLAPTVACGQVLPSVVGSPRHTAAHGWWRPQALVAGEPHTIVVALADLAAPDATTVVYGVGVGEGRRVAWPGGVRSGRCAGHSVPGGRWVAWRVAGGPL